MRYIDLFGGIGGFSYGIKKATEGNWHCVGYYDNDKYAVQTYNKNFGTSYEATDITTVSSDKIPEHDLLIAGFPCQSFSIAGKRKGFNDTRGTLFFEIARIARDKRPKYLLLENVKGLLNHDKGKTFATILETLSKLGYSCEWEVLNSKNFGVPQNRERVFIIGHLGGFSGRQTFPLGESGKELGGTPRETRSEGTRVFDYATNTIAQRDYKGGNQLIQMNKGIQTFTASSSGRGYIEKGRVDKRIQYSDTAQTLTAMQDSVRSGTYVNENSNIRRLTPTECERLQGFPDNWTAGVSDTQRYKQLGNAVTTNVVEAIITQMQERLNGV